MPDRAVARSTLPCPFGESGLKSSLLMTLYSLRSERRLCDRIRYDVMFRWFPDMNIGGPSSTLAKNREQLLGA